MRQKVLRILRSRPTFFIAGFATAVFFGAVIDYCDMLPEQPSEKLVRRWGVFERTPGQLNIPLEKGELIVSITVDSETRALRSILVAHENVGKMFKYVSQGEVGTPTAEYGGGPPEDGMTWVDLNADGRFDERFDFANERMEILISGTWIKAIRPDSVAETDQGKFQFDAKSGEWRPVVSEDKQ